MSANKVNPSFSDKLDELDAIVAWFGSDEIDLDAALKKFERGMELSSELKVHLKQTENTIKEIQAKHE